MLLSLPLIHIWFCFRLHFCIVVTVTTRHRYEKVPQVSLVYFLYMMKRSLVEGENNILTNVDISFNNAAFNPVSFQFPHLNEETLHPLPRPQWGIDVYHFLLCDTAWYLICCLILFLKVLSFKETLASYQSVYYVGTIVPIVCLLLGNVIKPARKPKAQKAEWGTYTRVIVTQKDGEASTTITTA